MIADPILLEVLRNEIATVTEEISIAIERTARSALMKLGDFATALADATGHVVSVHPSSPMFGTMFRTVLRGVLDARGPDIAEGDVFVSNDPYLGGSHKPDVFVVMPVHAGDELVGFTLAYSHHADIGGRFAGGFSSHAVNTYDEGLRMPALKLVAAGRRNEALVELLCSNVRNGEEFIADIEAKIAGCWRGAAEYRRIVSKYGRPAVEACFDHDRGFAELVARNQIRAIPDGRYSATLLLTDDGVGNDASLPLVCTLVVTGDELTVDLSGTAPQVPTGVNMPLANTHAQVYDALQVLLGIDVPYNEGFTRPIAIEAPPGTIVNPLHPAAVGGRASVFYLVAETVYRAMAVAVPERVPVPPDGADVVHVTGKRADGTEFSTMDIVWAGWGARPDRDGVDGAASNAYVGMPAELLERDAPVVVEEFGFVPDSEGAGRFRGGLSVVKRYRFLGSASVIVRTIRARESSVGMSGGAFGKPAVNVLVGTDGVATSLPRQTHLHLEISSGECLHHEVGGLGGHGPPSERAIELIRADVTSGKISPQRASDVYGVGLDDDERPFVGDVATPGKVADRARRL